jgi:hypothetical protein
MSSVAVGVKRFSTVLLAAGVLASSPPAFAAKPPPTPINLLPTSQWVVDYKADSCQLRRHFGEGDKLTLLVMSQYGPHDVYRMVFGGETMRPLAKSELKLRFGPTEAVQPKIGFHQAKLADGMFALALWSALRMEAQPDDPDMALSGKISQPLSAERQKAVTHLRIESGKAQPIILATGAMDKPLVALQKCVDDMVSYWGIDVAAHKTLQSAAYPKVSPVNWVNTNSYPDKMLAEGQSAIVEFRLDIGETGAVTGCHIQATTRPKEFDDAVCGSLMRKGKFNPAIDAGGKPIRSYYRSSVTFVTDFD